MRDEVSLNVSAPFAVAHLLIWALWCVSSLAKSAENQPNKETE